VAAADGSVSPAQVKGTVVIGTYDGALLGLSLESGEQIFGYAPHVGCVKSLHCNEAGALASGGTDSAVRLFDLARGVENGELMVHDDTVSCVRFWGSTSLISGDSEGTVCIWQCGTWEMLMKFRAHKAGVACLAVHPSGWLMASAGRDRGLRLWDLTRGTSAAHLSTDEVVEALEWSPDGGRVAALSPLELLVVRVSSCEALPYRNPNSGGLTRISLTAVMFLDGGEVVLGDGKGDLRVLEPASNGKGLVEVCRLPDDGKRGRIKALLRGSGGLFLVGSSAGRVELWHACPGTRAAEPGAVSQRWRVDTEARLTCAALWRVSGAAAGQATTAGAAGSGPRGGKRRPRHKAKVGSAASAGVRRSGAGRNKRRRR